MTRSRLGRWSGVALLVLLSACAAVPPASTDSRDRTTESDETDGDRRARVRMELATAYFDRGQMEFALDQVKLAIIASPNLAGAFNLRGLIYASLGDDKLAEESFRRALQLSPRDADSMQNFGWFLCQRKRYAEADAMFEQSLALPQQREPARTLLAQGVCLAFDRQYGASERALSRAYQLDPANPAIAVNLAEVLYRLGQYDRAQLTIRRVNAVVGVVSAQTLWLAARIERKLGNQQALEEFGARLRSQFANAPETEAFDKGRFGD